MTWILVISLHLIHLCILLFAGIGAGHICDTLGYEKHIGIWCAAVVTFFGSYLFPFYVKELMQRWPFRYLMREKE